MKNFAVLLVALIFLLPGCAIHTGITANLNNHTTEVVLTKNNFKVIEVVKGQSEARYIFGIGGLKKDAMLAEARANMLANANLIGSSRAVINETYEIRQKIYPFVLFYQVTVTGHIVEFTE